MNKKLEKNSSNLKIRLDKWLWAARFYKTRSLARNMIDGGKVHYNNQRTKSSRAVEIGACITLRLGFDEKKIIVEKIVDVRRGATEAQTLYRETEESIKHRQQRALERQLNAHNPSPECRPNKKQRRDLIKFKNNNE